MMQILAIGLGAGAASGLLFASVASGSPLLSMLLFYLAPLPILIAALGWSHWAGLVAALSAGIGSLSPSGFFFFTFMLGAGLPGWWLGYLTLLAQLIRIRPRMPGNLIRPAAW